ncbi:caspase family protein [Candidatus Pelagibacter sp.]|nr:caspase family protein [Candidatus Pelagibacter sp.]
MKRLLAYLFIVLGFGLTFNVSAKANMIQACLYENNYTTLDNPKISINFSYKYFKKKDTNDPKCESFSFKKDYKVYSALEKNLTNCKWATTTSEWDRICEISSWNYESLLNSNGLISKIYNPTKPDIKLVKKEKIIEKTEQSQTQKVVSSINSSSKFKAIICLKDDYNATGKFMNIFVLRDDGRSCDDIFGFTVNSISYSKYLEIKKDPQSYAYKWGNLVRDVENSICINNENLLINNLSSSCSQNETEVFAIEGIGDIIYLSPNKPSKTQIAKAEPTIKPKKKVKVAKVEEPHQEEFKPKKTNQDNEAPVITIDEAITVNDTSYILEGRVTDKANKIFVEIDGQPVQVKKGKFKVKRYSPVDEQIKIVAIDQWGNKSKTKLVNITIDIDETIVANKLEPLNPSNISNKSSNNKVALIIGIENYTEAPKANYANLDAKYFFDYARRAFGVKKQNINLLVNEEATVVKTDKAVSLWLKSKIKKNKSDLIIFFAGHGLASSDGKELYLLPQDGNPDRLERTALSRTDLFKEIISLNPKSVTMFLDTCYSGVSRDEQMLLASARPIRIVADEQEGIPDNFTIFSASQLDQISSGLKEANHGIFSYYLMKGMEGNADINKDKKITNGELLAYMDENVSQKAAEQGREQNPSLAGDPDKVLMSYR